MNCDLNVYKMPVRKYRREASEVSCCLKYVIFGFNVIFWLVGLSILAAGIWAWWEKDTFNNLSHLTNIALDPAFILILVGTVTFIIGFTGCVGALRENTCLLAAYAIFLGILLLLEMAAGILGFIFKDWIKNQATGGFQTFIIHYREDPDQQNLIDWIQEDWLQCCGIEGPKDWDKNNYFNCSSQDVGSREACGVPFSCCKRKPNLRIMQQQISGGGSDHCMCSFMQVLQCTGLLQTAGSKCVKFMHSCGNAGKLCKEIIKNKQCGYDVRKPGYQYDVAKIINEKGCVQAGEEWMERNLLIVAGVAVATAFLQVLGICFAQNLRADIFAQKAKWH